MTSKKVNLVISLNDKVSGGLSKIGGGLKKLGISFKAVSLAAVAGFAAIGAGLAALGKAFAEQEAVNNRLASAFNAAGESGAQAVERWGAFATAIQRTTTLGDEEIMNLVTLGKVMGVTNDKLEESTKGAIGLSKAFGIDMTASMKMVALAQQGEFEMLARYIPALRQATTEAEKQVIVQTAMANGFKMAEAELDTMSGQMEAFKGVVGDAMQEAGRVVGDAGFTGAIKMAKEAIIELTEDGSLTAWAEAGSKVFSRWITGVTQLAQDLGRLTNTFIDLSEAFKETKNPFEISGLLQSKAAERNQKKMDDDFNKASKERSKTLQEEKKAEQADFDKTMAEWRKIDEKKVEATNNRVPWYKDPKMDGIAGEDAKKLANAGKTKVSKARASSSGASAISEQLTSASESAGEGGRGQYKGQSGISGAWSLIGQPRSVSEAAASASKSTKSVGEQSQEMISKLAEERNKLLEQISKNIGGVSEG
tara:strand:+ start:92 stop:1531 length:1440 start_codon:yes stop_codon:yes gene_type:complete